jgi:hypothetical protein
MPLDGDEEGGYGASPLSVSLSSRRLSESQDSSYTSFEDGERDDRHTLELNANMFGGSGHQGEEYDPRQDPNVHLELQQMKLVALQVWSRKTLYIVTLQIIPIVLLIWLQFNLSSFSNATMILFGYLCACVRRYELCLTRIYLLLTVVNCAKDIFLIATQAQPAGALIVLLVDICVLAPSAMYISYFHYSTVRSAAQVL